MDLSNSLKAFGKDDFDSALWDNLNEHFNDLPLGECSLYGGWPDGEDGIIDFALNGTSEDNDCIYADAEVLYTESQPTSCHNVNLPHRVTGFLRITIEKTDGSAGAELTERSTPDYDGDYY